MVEHQKILSEILEIEPRNKFLGYIVRRVSRPNYRGMHVSQHNRLRLGKVVKILKAILEIAGEEIFKIPPGDDSGRELPGYDKYYMLVKHIQKKMDKGTINSIKKNLFPDFEKMGFLIRHKEGRSVKNAKISETGLRMIKAESIERHKIFTDGIDKLFNKEISNLAETLYLSEDKEISIELEEFMLILSDNDPKFGRAEKMETLRSFRTLKRHQRLSAIKLLKSYCDPNKFNGDKTEKRDYHNWKNQSQQIFVLLKQTSYFDVTKRSLGLNTGEFGIFVEGRRNRRLGTKRDYFENHKIEKREDFELHHVVPFSSLRNKEEFIAIDSWQNLVYLHKNKHAEFRGKDRFVLNADEEELIFCDFGGDNCVTAQNSKNAAYKGRLCKEMQKYNRDILRKLFDFP